MEKIDDILEKVSEQKLDEQQEKSVFYLEKSYYIKSLILIAVLVFVIFTEIYKFSRKPLLQIIIIVLVILYLAFYIYKLFKYKLVIDNNILSYGKTKINLKEIKSVKLMRTHVGGTKYDNCLALIDNKNERYIIRLNISNKYLFIAKISKITKKKVEK